MLTVSNHVLQLRNEINQPAGELVIQGVELFEKPSFVDYLRSGWNINLSVGIDFTASNGEVIEPTSLHRQYENGE